MAQLGIVAILRRCTAIWNAPLGPDVIVSLLQLPALYLMASQGRERFEGLATYAALACVRLAIGLWLLFGSRLWRLAASR